MSLHVQPEPRSSIRLPPEIGFLAAQGFAPSTLSEATDMARRSGTDAATALLNAGLIDEETFYRALSRALGTDFLEQVRLSPDADYRDVLRTGASRLESGSGHGFVAAPRGPAIARLMRSTQTYRGAITSPTRLRQTVFANCAEAIAADAAYDLLNHRPEWSCRPGPTTSAIALGGVAIVALLVGAHLPGTIGLAILAAIQLCVLAMLNLRIAAVAVASSTDHSDLSPRLRDDALPTYTVLVALYREAKMVRQLLQSLRNLDYPHAKLQIIILLEADDAETIAAFRAIPRMPARFEVVTVPTGLPRTKPRALNAALPLARGDLLVVYDAEDEVDPQQLRKAAAIFARSSPRTACLQGRLVVDDKEEGLLHTLFAIEYAGLFDVMGPALAAWRLPTPLGGTSTHLRTSILKSLHGWDAWNVTEDADLGMRLARAGYDVGDLPSSTLEETAPSLRAWLRQRTRWLKGFLQTSFTHGRNPRHLMTGLGLRGTLTAVALLPGTVVSALVYPFLMPAAASCLLFGLLDPEPSLMSSFAAAGSLLVFAGGFTAMLLPAFVGCLRRKWVRLLPYVVLLPFYYLLVSLAAWLAVFELIRHPHRWNKTEHGLSKRSNGVAGRAPTVQVKAVSKARRQPPSVAVAG